MSPAGQTGKTGSKSNQIKRPEDSKAQSEPPVRDFDDAHFAAHEDFVDSPLLAKQGRAVLPQSARRRARDRLKPTGAAVAE